MDSLIHLDHEAFHLINQIFAHAWLDLFFPYITDLHKQIWFQILVYPTLLFFYVRKFRKKGVLYFFMGLLSIGFSDWSGSKLLKNTVERQRPFETQGIQFTQRSPARGKSFISNHAANMFAFATYTSAFFPQAKPAFFLAAGLVAYSRVYNGVHFPLDVICGALWGTSVSLLFLLISQKLAAKFPRERKASSK